MGQLSILLSYSQWSYHPTAQKNGTWLSFSYEQTNRESIKLHTMLPSISPRPAASPTSSKPTTSPTARVSLLLNIIVSCVCCDNYFFVNLLNSLLHPNHPTTPTSAPIYCAGGINKMTKFTIRTDLYLNRTTWTVHNECINQVVC